VSFRLPAPKARKPNPREPRIKATANSTGTSRTQMHETIDFLIRHGYLVLLGWVFAEQIGVPVPSLPVMLAAGALAGSGQLSFWTSLLLVTFSALCADIIWYLLGKTKGIRILQFLCKISLEPDSCVRRTEGIFSKQGARSLLLAKFIPGLGTVAPPLAGIFHMRARNFVLYDGAGSFLWGFSILGTGYIFSAQIERIAEWAARLGGSLAIIIVGGLTTYLLWKYIGRQKFLRDLRIARITPSELKAKLDAQEDLAIVDLRHSMDFEADPETIPGAFRIDAKELEAKAGTLPHDREVILYCT
jgi:membrane protein DedA with SNARE-associated domain